MPRDTPPATSRLSRRGLVIAGVAVVLGLGFVVSNGIASRSATDLHLRDWTEAQAVPTVSVVTPPWLRQLHVTSFGRSSAIVCQVLPASVVFRILRLTAA